jgi:uracil phosphoribosyltransferase
MATSDNGTNHDFGPNVFVSKHPVLSHKITILRSSSTTPSTFRSVLQEVTYHLGYEATSAMTTRPIEVSVSAGKEEASQHQDCTGQKLVEHTALIPILRSGLGMSDSMLQLLPKSAVHHIGMYRIPGHAPVQYFNRLPKKCTADIAFVLDPALGSASTMMAVVAQIKKVRKKIS